MIGQPSDTKRTVVYTALLGDRDSVIDPPQSFPKCEYICYTDRKTQLNIWSICSVRQTLDSPRRDSRMYKLLPHRFLPPHDVSIWVDANIRPAADPETLVAGYLKGHDIVSFHHPARTCAYHEAAICTKNQTDPVEVIERQIESYRSQGYPEDNGLAAAGVLIRRNTERVKEFNELWWHEVANSSVRDQISFNYAIWKTGLDWGILPGRVEDSPLFTHRPHEN